MVSFRPPYLGNPDRILLLRILGDEICDIAGHIRSPLQQSRDYKIAFARGDHHLADYTERFFHLYLSKIDRSAPR